MRERSKGIGVGSRQWGTDWGGTGKRIYLVKLLQCLSKEVKPFLEQENLYLGFFFEIPGQFKFIETVKFRLTYTDKYRWISCSIDIPSDCLTLGDDEFLALFLSWIESFIPKIVKRLKSRGVEIDFETFTSKMESVCQEIRVSGIVSAPDLDTKAKLDEIGRLWAEGHPIDARHLDIQRE